MVVCFHFVLIILVEPWSLSIFKHDRALFPYIYGPKSLDNIYFEMICAKRPRDVELQPNVRKEYYEPILRLTNLG